MASYIFNQAELNRLYRYCVSLTADADQGFDLLQDGLERYLRVAPEHAQNPMAYLRRIIRNRFIDGVRAKGWQLVELSEGEDLDCVAIGTVSLESMVIAEQDLERIWSALQPLERELLCLWALEGYTAREIAEQVGSPVGTVLARIHRLRRKLQRESLADGDGSVGTRHD